jgi:hypothetical protein
MVMRAELVSSDTITDSLQFWEIGRVAYNIILTAVVVGTVGPATLLHFSPNNFAALGVLAVFANVLYCAAYPVDLFVQASHWRAEWKRVRWMLWIIGTMTASWLAFSLFAAMGPFGKFGL